MWPTASARDWKGVDRTTIDRGNARPLNEVVAHWSTPDAFVSNDGEQPETFLARRAAVKAKGINGNGMGTPLAMQAKMWSTPSVADVTGGRSSRSGDRQDEMLLNGQSRAVSASALPALQICEPGETSSPDDPTSPRLQLNPTFVSWLMGWDVPASTNFGFSEMGSSPWSQLMRSALSRLELHDEAPPAQPSLFA